MMERRKFLGYSIIALMLGGCTQVGPNFNGVPKSKIPKKWSHKGGKDPAISRWWHIYQDKTLNRLVDMAYRQNIDLKMAGVRILQSRAVLGIQNGMSLPQLQKLSGGAFVNDANQNSPTFGSSSLAFDLGWELDIWGKYARGTESAQAKLYASVASYDSMLVSIIAEVAKSYINYRTAQERIIYARRNIAIQEYVTKITKIQFNSGNVSELDMQQALTQLHSTRSAVYELKLSQIRARNSIAMLLGLNPTEVEKYITNKDTADDMSRYITNKKGTIQLKEQSSAVSKVSLIPSPRFDPHKKIDANLITRRPDVKVAEYIAHSKSADIGVAEAELYPSFSLIGNISYADTTISPSKISIIAGPSFAWNILQYGRIKNSIRLKDAQFEESLLQYNKTVLSAIHEVSYALDNYRYTLKQLKESKKAVMASARAFNISIRQYNDGLVSYQRLLNSVESLTRYQDQYARLNGELATQVALLYKALGGGWQISRGNSYLSKDTVAHLKSRSNWGSMLSKDGVILPRNWQ